MPDSFYYIDLESVVSGTLVKDVVVDRVAAPSRAQRVLQKNDVLFQTVRPYQKNNYFFRTERSIPTVASTGYAQIRTDEVPQFVYELLHTSSFNDDVLVRCTGSSYPAVNANDLKEIVVCIPAKEEQKKIACFLDTLDARIAIQSRLVTSLKLYKRGVVKHLLTAKPSDGWICGKIGNLGSFHKGASLSKADIHADGHPMILYGELYTTYSEVISTVVRKTQATVDKVYLSRIGDVIMPTSGETPEEISTASCVMIPGVVLAGDLLIYRSTEVDGRIMSYALNHVINDRVARIAQGKSVVHVQSSEIGNIEIALPPLEIQVEYANFLEHLSAIINAEQRCSEQLLMLKASLLQQMFI